MHGRRLIIEQREASSTQAEVADANEASRHSAVNRIAASSLPPRPHAGDGPL